MQVLLRHLIVSLMDTYHDEELPVAEDLEVCLQFLYKGSSLNDTNLGSIVTNDFVRWHKSKCSYHAQAHHHNEDDVHSRRHTRCLGLFQSQTVLTAQKLRYLQNCG